MRQRRTIDQLGQLDAQILKVLRHDNPQSVRHVFYRMTDPRLPEPVEKSERGYRHVQDRIAKLRRVGRLPFAWITDATRRGYFVPTFLNGADFLRSMVGHYRADLWANSDFYCEVWAESRSIAGVIQGLCEELAVSLYPSGGFSSMTLTYEAARHIKAAHDGRRVCIFYIGDYDPAGVLIDKAIERDLRGHSEGVEITFERLGITEEQIALYDLPVKPRKATDKRAMHITGTVEAEAMPAGILRQILRERIEALLPPHALAVTKVVEECERKGLLALANALEEEPGDD